VLEVNDGVFAVPTDGPDRGYLKQFFAGVPGGEVSGPVFNPDNTALFVSIQHPGEGSSFDDPSTSWPETSGPPRPTVVVIQKDDGGPIGS
jgi:secreted PhoX family phosphatase